jgi:hypothetical protein
MREKAAVHLRRSISLVLATSLVGGCVHIEMTVQMLDEGGATVTERVRYSGDLMELDRRSAADQRLAPLLERPAVEARAQVMGKGAALVSHEVVDLPGGARESRAVYSIPDLEDLRLINPFLTQGPSGRLMRFRFTPIYRVVHSYHALGEMMLELVPAEPAPRGPTSRPATVVLSPRQLQALRDVQPIFADLARDFQITLRLNATEPIRWGHVRDAKSATTTIIFLSFTGQDLDMYNRPFLDNEELMLDLMQFDLDADNLLDHTETFTQNPTVPVLLARRPYAAGLFRIKPTKGLFTKYFHGRPKSQGGDVDDAPAAQPAR